MAGYDKSDGFQWPDHDSLFTSTAYGDQPELRWAAVQLSYRLYQLNRAIDGNDEAAIKEAVKDIIRNARRAESVIDDRNVE